MNFKNLLLATAAMAALSACKEQPTDEELFIDALDITTNYNKPTGEYVALSTETEITVLSGDFVNFNYGIGGENGIGEKTVSTFELITETSRGKSTCDFIPASAIVSGANVYWSVNESASYTFKITSTEGDTSLFGPIKINAQNDNEVYISRLNLNSNQIFVAPGPNQSYPFRWLIGGIGYDNFNSGFPILGHKAINGKMHLVSPHKFTEYGIASEYTSEIDCGFRITKIAPYSGPIELDTFEFSNYTYADLNDFDFSNTQDTLEVKVGRSFIFQTEEGKNGIGRFATANSGSEVSFFFEYQK